MEDILIGTTDRTILVFIPDPASTTGAGKTGLTASAVTVTYTRVETDNDVVHTDVTSSVNDLSALTDAHTDWGWKEVSATLSKGLYRLDLADAVFAAGAWSAVVQVTITSGTAAATPKGFRLIARNDLTDIAQTADHAASVAAILEDTGTTLDGKITTIDDFLDTEVAAILAAVDTEVAAILALLDDPRGEPGQGAPPVNPDCATKIDYLFKFLRNKVTQTSTQMTVFADDGSTADHKSTVSDDGTTYTRGEFVSGA
jgi:hypothetical protein